MQVSFNLKVDNDNLLNHCLHVNRFCNIDLASAAKLFIRFKLLFAFNVYVNVNSMRFSC